MSSTTVGPVGLATPATGFGGVGSSGGLGKLDFLKLLVAQMRHQDPMSPTDSSAFIAELAQFNALEQMQQMNETIAMLVGLQSLSEASGLIGRKVQVLADNGQDTVTGTVTQVKMAGGQIKLVIDGKEYPFDNLVAILSSPQVSVKRPATANAPAGNTDEEVKQP